MSYTRTDLAAIIGKKTLHIGDTKVLAKEVAAYLMENNHVSDLESLMRDVLAYRQSHGVLEAEVTSAHELDDQTINEVKQLLKQHYPDAKKVVVHTSIDPEVVGGLRVTLANEQLDMSVRSKLDMFRRLTTEGNI